MEQSQRNLQVALQTETLSVAKGQRSNLKQDSQRGSEKSLTRA